MYEIRLLISREVILDFILVILNIFLYINKGRSCIFKVFWEGGGRNLFIYNVLNYYNLVKNIESYL